MLALIAGRGTLPLALVRRLTTAPLVCSLVGFPPEDVDVAKEFRIEQLGSFINDLKAAGITEVCFAGGIDRPAIDPSAIDAATFPLVPVLQKAIASGDDGALRAVVGIFEAAGLAVRGAHELAPDLLPQPGALTQAQPTEAQQADAKRAADVVGAMAAVDIGQACVVHRRQVLAVEGVFGTDWMLRSLAHRPDSSGGVLFKAPKPGQDQRVDLPVIGPSTVAAAVDARLSGIVIAAGGVMVLDLDSVVAACDAADLFLWVMEP